MYMSYMSCYNDHARTSNWPWVWPLRAEHEANQRAKDKNAAAPIFEFPFSIFQLPISNYQSTISQYPVSNFRILFSIYGKWDSGGSYLLEMKVQPKMLFRINHSKILNFILSRLDRRRPRGFGSIRLKTLSPSFREFDCVFRPPHPRPLSPKGARELNSHIYSPLAPLGERVRG
jgi:hypothetical protein